MWICSRKLAAATASLETRSYRFLIFVDGIKGEEPAAGTVGRPSLRKLTTC